VLPASHLMYASGSQAHQPSPSCRCRGSFGGACRDPLLRMLLCPRIHGDGTGANMMQQSGNGAPSGSKPFGTGAGRQFKCGTTVQV
jgi:hypothetical protein